jgi:hypothetical protein
MQRSAHFRFRSREDSNGSCPSVRVWIALESALGGGAPGHVSTEPTTRASIVNRSGRIECHACRCNILDELELFIHDGQCPAHS